MPSVINTNMPSLFAQRNLNKSQGGLETSLQRLSSGLRINSAKDDAAGMSIAERMTSQIRGLNQASRNTNDGISLAQTAEGALSDIANALQRLRELSVQSANATNTDVDRAALQEEAAQLVSEVDRISSQTAFNGVKLLNGDFTKQTFQVGANAHETIDVTMKSARTKDLGAVTAASLSSRQAHLSLDASASGSLHTIDQGDLVINGVIIGTALASDDTASDTKNAQSAIAKAAAINRVSDQTGVAAKANINTAEGSGMTTTASAVAHTVVINGVTVINNVDFSSMSAAERRAAVVSAINEKSGQTGVIARDSGTADGGVVLEASDGRNIYVSGSQSGTMSLELGLEAGLHMGSFSLSSDKAIEIQDGNGRLSDAGLIRGVYDTQKAYVASPPDLSTSFNAGDFLINDVVVGETLASDDTASSVNNDKSAISKAAAINKLSEQTGVQAVVNENIVNGVSMAATALTGTIVINGIQTSSITTSTDTAESRRLVVEAINAISGQTGVHAVDSGIEAKGVQLVAEDGRNITLTLNTITSAATGIFQDAGSTHYGTFTLESADAFTIKAGFNNEEGVDHLGLGVGSYGQGRSGESLDNLDISTQEGATKALTSLDNAIQTINSQRSSLGALQNRFMSTISNLDTQSENLTASRSRIQDADFAKETAELTRNQILQQAGVAMLSQANQLPQQVMQLLQG